MEQRRRYWEKETLKYNWQHARMLLIADIIHRSPAGSTVLDLGAGKAMLARLIGPSYRYLGLDIVGGPGTEPRVEACDFDHLQHYHLSGTPYDIIVVSGLLEYLQDWRGFLQYVTGHWLVSTGTLLVSFTNARGYQKAPVHKHPEWKNILSLPEILQEMDRLSLSVESVYPLFWGNKRWGLPFVRTLAIHGGNYLRLDRAWISQYLCIARPVPKTR